MSRIRPLMEVLDIGSRRSARPLKICVVTSEFIGPVKNGGIGAATTGLLETLRKDNHDVSVLYTLVQHGTPVCAERDWPHWEKELKKKKITLHYINNEQDYRAWRLKSWLVMEHLRDHDYDFVFFNEHHASGFYSIEAKKCGIEPFASQTHCVWTHGSLQWVFEINDQYISRTTDIELMSMERRTVEQADIVLGPSRYILQKYQSYGWQLPEMTFHQPLPLLQNPIPQSEQSRKDVDEIVFFGRLETRKGLWIFCDALDRLGNELAGKRVTFLGRTTAESGFSSGTLLMARSQNWPFDLRLINDFGQEAALEYLRGAGRLAVIPSLADNSPCVIYECMENGVPFISTLGSGIQELVDKRDWRKVLVEPNAADLADKIRHVLKKGAAMARPAFDTRENLKGWSAFSRYIGQRKSADRKKSEPAGKELDAALFWVDSGKALSLLARNLISNLARNRARYPAYLITLRGEAVRDMIGEIVGGSETDFAILDADDREAINRVLAKKPHAVFADTEIEIMPRFFESAARTLAGADMVSCVVAERSSVNDETRITKLPCGNIMGLPFLGYAMGSGLWACSTKALADRLRALSFRDEETDRYLSATELGQQLMLECATGNLEYQLMPVVGGVGTYTEPSYGNRAKPFANISKRAETASVKPSVREGGPVWLSMCEFAVEQGQALETPGEMHLALPAAHPLSMIRNGELADTAENEAAAFGRGHLAFELAANRWMDEESGRNIVDLLTAARRHCPKIDLLPSLSDAWCFGDSERSIGRTSHREMNVAPRLQALLEERGMVEASKPSRPVSRPAEAVTPDRIDGYCRAIAVRRTQSGLRLDSTARGAGEVLFFDVPLAGHSSFEITLHTDSPCSGTVETAVIDEKYGSTISSSQKSVRNKETIEIDAPLDGLFIDAVLRVKWNLKRCDNVFIDKMILS